MTREARMRRAKLVTVLNLLAGALVFCHIWSLWGPGLGLTFLIGLVICGACFHRLGLVRCVLGFGTLGVLLLCLYFYLYSDPDPATIDRFYGTLAMGHLLGVLSYLSLYYWKPGYFELAQPLSGVED